jgi:diguanylate cyclase (GGDEF)-like protein/PAS domain S-box-containing protein
MSLFELLVPSIYVIAAIFYALLGLYAWRKRPAAGVESFAWIMLSMSIWSFTYALEIFFPLLQTKLMVLNFEYIGILGVPIFIFNFALDFTGRSHLITSKWRILLWSVPAAILLLTWTNPLHQLMWDQATTLRSGALTLLDVQFGPASWTHIIFTFVLVIASCIILVMELLQRPGTLRLQISLVILSIFFSLFGSSTFVLDVSPINGLDFAPLFFLPAAVGLSWVTLSYRLSEILSIEHITVLKNMKDSVIVMNGQKRILYINHVAERLLNLTEDTVIGQPFQQVAGKYAAILDPYLKGEEQHDEIEINEGDEEKTFELFVSPIRSSTHTVPDVIITLHDITQRKEREEELSRHGAIMAAISSAAEQFLKTSDWELSIADVLKKLGQAADVSRVFVTINPMSDHGVHFSKLKHEWSQNNVPYTTSPLSHVALPVIVEGEWWASITFDEYRHERQWTSMELEAFQTAASILAAAETRARTVEQLHRRQLALSLLQDIVTASLQARNMHDMADIATERLAKLVQADGCFLTLWNDATKITIPVAAFGKQQETYSNISVSAGEKTFTMSCLELERTLAIEDVNNTPYAAPSVVKLFSSRSILALPLIATEKKLGAILVSYETQHFFIDEEIKICEQAAALVALALEKFQAMDEARQRADTSESLRKAGIAIAEKVELNQAVNHVLEQLKQMVPYDSASIQLRSGDELYIIGGHGWKNSQDVLNLRFPIPGNNPNTVVIERGSPFYLPDAGEVYEHFKDPPHDHIRSWLGIPLIVQEKVIGLLAIDSSNPNDFSEREIEIASEFAKQVASTLENARILQETQTRAVTDVLTGVFNRRGLMELGEVEFTRALALNRPFSAIMLDLDHFKIINDTHGHAAGDVCLHEFAKRCKSCIREIDYIGRYGGEELIILLPDAHMKASMNIAERLRIAISKSPILVDNKRINITASLGVACKDENTNSLEMLIARADQAMYIAKHNGRNRVAVSP